MRRGAFVLAVTVTVALLPTAVASGDPPAVERLAGADRYETAAAIAEATHPAGAATVFVATGEDFPDGLAGGPAAAAAGGPVLLTARDRLPPATAAALDRLEPDEVVLLGGTAAVTPAVEDNIAARGAEVRRIAGPTRVATAAAVADTFEPGVPRAYVARADDFPDALAAAAAGGVAGGPVLLTSHGALPAATAAALERLEPEEIAVLGGTAAVSEPVLDALAGYTAGAVERLAGSDRYATAVAVSQATFDDADVVYLASGTNFPDALAGGQAAARDGAPLLLTRRTCLPASVRAEIERLAPERLVILGGERAVGPGAAQLAPCERVTSVVAERLAVPWDVVFTPDDRVFVSERDSGNLLELRDGEHEVVQQLEVNPAGEGGLLGLAVSPTYQDDGLLYAYLTTAVDNRVVRLRPGSDPEVVLDGIPRANVHNGGRIAFGPDGLLYVTTGDAGDPARSQDLGDLAGKVLRVTADGQAPPDNPFSSPVLAFGLRNPQGLAWDGQGRLIVTEFGPGVDDAVLVVAPGSDQGWGPQAITTAGARAFPDPIAVKQPPVASWSGLAVLDGGSIPQWEGDVFVAALRGERLWRFRLGDAGPAVEEEALLVGEFGRLRHVTTAPDGSLWVLTSNRDGRGAPVDEDDRIVRIGPPG